MTVEFKLPDIGEGVVEGEIVKWLVRPGETVIEDQPMVEIMTDKATVEIPSPVAGRVVDCIGEAGATVEVGSTLVVIETDQLPAVVEPDVAARSGAIPKAPEKAAREKAVPAESQAAVLATPAIRKQARDWRIDLNQIRGTGPGGRITREDLDSFRSQSVSERPGPAGRKERPVESKRIPYRGLRKKIGDRMVQSKRTAPHFTYVEEVDATELVRLREQYQRQRLDGQPGITYLPFILKAVVEGLRKFPLLNATLEEAEGEIRVQGAFNFGVAVATDEGLIVPVVRDVDQKGIFQLAQEVARLADAARSGRIAVEDLRGGTFTITSLGALGGIFATPIINVPEVAILGVHKISRRSVVRDNQIVIREMMYLSLSVDHRVVDGAMAAKFVQWIVRFLEHPGLLLLV